MRRSVGRGGSGRSDGATAAALPGTTLGVLRVSGLLPAGCKMFDTPGVPHPHALTAALAPQDAALLQPRGRLKPRTFRAAAGQVGKGG